MVLRSPRFTRTDTLLPYTTLCRSGLPEVAGLLRKAGLRLGDGDAAAAVRRSGRHADQDRSAVRDLAGGVARPAVDRAAAAVLAAGRPCRAEGPAARGVGRPGRSRDAAADRRPRRLRSEEHTSELQSLMRNS